MASLLTPRPNIAPEYKSGDFTLAEGWENDQGIHVQGSRVSISEHPGGRLSAIITKDDGEGSFTCITLTHDATDALRRYLNRAHAERSRPADRVTVTPA